MRRSLKILPIAFVLIAALAAVPVLYANDTHGSGRSMMERGRTGQGGMMGMMGMMNMMGQMGQMMDQCNQMMGGMMGGRDSGRPNEQWRDKPPAAPEKKG